MINLFRMFYILNVSIVLSIRIKLFVKFDLRNNFIGYINTFIIHNMLLIDDRLKEL